jgi:hypothetical protein
MFNWDREMLEGKTDESRAWREKPDAFWSKKFNKDVTPRWVLQHFGTEVMRQNMHDAIWVDSCMARYDGKPTVIADTRFENEIKQYEKWEGRYCSSRGDRILIGSLITWKETSYLKMYIRQNMHGPNQSTIT